MKSIKTLLVVASILLATFANSARADVTIRIGGSTAFRGAVHNAIANLMGSGCQAAYIGSNLNGANQAVFVGTVSGISGTTTIETSWSGSVSGVAALAANLKPSDYQTQLPDVTTAGLPYITASTANGLTLAAVTTTNAVNGSSNFGLFTPVSGGKSVTAAQAVSDSVQFADLAFSDAYQNTTAFSTKLGFSKLTDTLVGVLPFVAVKGSSNSSDTDVTNGTYGRITNITSQQWKNLLAQGQVGAYALTGNPADTCLLTVTGRDHDSGTRIETFAETTFGVAGSPIQFEVNVTGGNSAAGPGSSVISLNEVDASGYASGGTLANVMNTPGEDGTLGGYIIGYLGVGDADSALSATGGPSGYSPIKQLQFNGVTESKAAVDRGAYSFWVNEHFLSRSASITANGTTEAAASGDISTLYTALKNDLTLTTSTNKGDARVAGYLVSETHATRSLEGGAITAP